MVSRILKFFEKTSDKNASAGGQAAGGKSTGGQAVGGRAAGDDILVATCALFLEMARIDGEFSEEEQQSILSILTEQYDLSDEHAGLLMSAAREQLDQSLDYWQFANLINQNYSEEEKVEIIEMAWRIVYVDGRLDKHEDYLMHKLSKLLCLSHRQLIDAKLKAKRDKPA
jgi:uncharacterized tellurite resistance protein B-like protein